MKTKEAARMLRTIKDPKELMLFIPKIDMDTFIKAYKFNIRAGLGYQQPSIEELNKHLGNTISQLRKTTDYIMIPKEHIE